MSATVSNRAGRSGAECALGGQFGSIQHVFSEHLLGAFFFRIVLGREDLEG